MMATWGLLGFFHAVRDVAQNFVEIWVQENQSRVILSSMDALWSLRNDMLRAVPEHNGQRDARLTHGVMGQK